MSEISHTFEHRSRATVYPLSDYMDIFVGLDLLDWPFDDAPLLSDILGSF